MALNLEKAAARPISPAAAFMNGVYSWMCGGLLLTALTAWLATSSPQAAEFFTRGWVFWTAVIAEFIIVLSLPAMIGKISSRAAAFALAAYSILNGITFAGIFMIYDMKSISAAFFSTAGMFAAMSAYGWMTKRNLAGMGSFMFAGLVGIIIASLINMIIGSSALMYVISFLGIIIFLGLTAFDTQKLVALAQGIESANPESARKLALMGALSLYLDFINIFVMLLQLFGGRK